MSVKRDSIIPGIIAVQRSNRYRHTPKKRLSLPGPAFRRMLGHFRGMTKATALAGLVCGLSVLCVFGHDLITQAEYFRAVEIHISGEQVLSEAAITDWLEIATGDNILALNLGLLHRRLVAHPWVREASIQRELPNRLRIHLTEERPLAILDLGRRFIIDEGGRIFKEWQAGDPSDLPLVTGLTYIDLPGEGGVNSRPYQAVLDILAIARHRPSLLHPGMFQQVAVDRHMGLMLHGRPPVPEIRLGYDGYLQKLERHNRVLAYLRQSEFPMQPERIDLRLPGRVAIKLKAAGMTETES